MILDYVVNLSIFSLLVSTPLVIRSYMSGKPLKQVRLLVSVYAGIVTTILILMAIHVEGYSFDIRYAPIILVFSYMGPLAGLITGAFALITRLLTADNWYPAIVGWGILMTSFTLIHFYTTRYSPVKRSAIYFGSYVIIYTITVPFLFNIFRHDPIFHFQYILFVMIGVVIGSLLIESYEKLYRTNAKLEASEFKYRLIAENTSDLIMLMNQEKSIMYQSPSHATLLGYELSDLQQMNWYDLVHPMDVPFIRETINALFEQKLPQSLEFRIQHCDGHWLDIETRGVPVLDNSEQIEHIVFISRDISERKKSEEFLLQSEKLSIVGELAAGVAHEIRNPLTTIKGFVQLYKNENYSIEFTDLLLSELERIESITSELLSLGKPQAVQLNRANLHQLVENTLDLLLPQALMSGIQFRFTAENVDLYTICEKNQLRQVFLNILKNAMEAMPNGGEIHIHLSKGENDDCLVSFQDQGGGIPEELLPRLGEPFYSLKEKGTGLGLMICNKIITQHNGSISYDSKVNEGTTVIIQLPLIS